MILAELLNAAYSSAEKYGEKIKSMAEDYENYSDEELIRKYKQTGTWAPTRDQRMAIAYVLQQRGYGEYNDN